MSQLEPVIWQVSSPVPRAPATDRELRQAFRTASVQAEVQRERGRRERLYTLGIATAVCCGLMLNAPTIALGVEIGLATVRGLGGFL
ncbi:hypothetical protein [Jannaschia formosa]|uniref:hypothetical protein n=1 Tax=Jannaschia formosa TaxID=2259592 RepID=UPI000E1BA6DC|nr:hypothetical protein [Jannaschia formosa]TFL20162.1 hypothetical protein DR046_02100 [Jannaschia formosa]